MSEEIRVSRPAQQPAPQMQSAEMMQSGGSSKMPWIILAVVVVVIVVLAFLFRDKLFSKSASTTAMVKASDYQAIFLTNGQVYFGKLSDADSDYVTMKDIYYLQVVQQPPLQGSNQPAGSAPAQAQQQISLVKLGNELHGPTDEMHISRAQVLFYEDLKSDSQVVSAITQYKANPAATPTPAK